MATQGDARRIALSLPDTAQEPGDRFSIAVRHGSKLKAFVWVWLERIEPKKARVPQPKVLAVRTASLDDKEFLLEWKPEWFFTEPHYNGYPAVLLKLPAISVKELRPIIEEAWACQAPKALVKAHEAGRKKP